MGPQGGSGGASRGPWSQGSSRGFWVNRRTLEVQSSSGVRSKESQGALRISQDSCSHLCRATVALVLD